VDRLDHKVLLEDLETLEDLLMAAAVAVVPAEQVVLELHLIVHYKLVEVVLEDRFLQHLEIQCHRQVQLQQHLQQVAVV
jgi:hypothetical protein